MTIGNNCTWIKQIAVLTLSGLMTLSAMANHSISISANGRLLFSDESGSTVATFDNGTIAQTVTVGSETFRLSYGKDVSGNPTILIYADPAQPKELSFSGFGKTVHMSKDAVLTIVTTPDGQGAVFKPGMLGKVTVDGSELAGGDTLNVVDGNVLAQSPLSTKETTLTEDLMKPSHLDTSLKEEAPATSEHTEGAVITKVQGQVEITSPSGNTKTAQVKDLLAVGTRIKTGSDGILYATPFPKATFMVEPNSEVVVTKAQYNPSSKDKKYIALLSVKSGGVINLLQGLDPSMVDYQVEAPEGVIAAHGTFFRVFSGSGKLIAEVSESTVTVYTREGNYSFPLSGGSSVVLNKGSTSENIKIEDLSPEQLAGLNSFRDILVDLISKGPTAEAYVAANGDGPPIGNPPPGLPDLPAFLGDPLIAVDPATQGNLPLTGPGTTPILPNVP